MMKGMKNIKWLSGVFVMALGLLAFGACSDDDDNVKLNFPEKQAIDCAAKEEKTLTFNAERSWTLASSRLWCKFKEGNDIVNSLSGGPGQQTVTITVTEDTWGFEDAVANLIMGMEGQTQVIATVNRAAKAYTVEAYQMVGTDKVVYNDENPVILPYYQFSSKYTKVQILANFDWKIMNCPEWIKVEEYLLMGEAGEIVTWELQFLVREGFSRTDIQEADLKFVDANGALRLTVPVKYDGIPEDKIDFSIKAYGWSFSADATNYWAESGVDGGVSGDKKPAPMAFTAIAKDGFKMAYMTRDEYYSYTIVDKDDAWFEVDVNEHQIKLQPTINEGKKRFGVLAIVPNKVFTEQLQGNFENMFDQWGGLSISDEYLFEFTQEAQQSAGKIAVRDDATGASLPLTDISEDVGFTAYRLTLSAGKAYDSITATFDNYLGRTFQLAVQNQWEGVEYEMPWGQKAFSIFGISSGEKNSEMEFRIIDTEGETYAALYITQY